MIMFKMINMKIITRAYVIKVVYFCEFLLNFRIKILKKKKKKKKLIKMEFPRVEQIIFIMK